jgi:hypothetical protein
MAAQNSKPKRPSIVLTAVIAWLIAGTLDALAAIFILAGGDAKGIFLYVASAVYGNAAFTGGTGMVLTGAAFHYFIAGCFTVFYFIIYPYIGLFKKSRLASIVIYAVFTWCVMHLLVLPLSKLPHSPFSFSGSLEDVAILMFTIGLPLTIMRYWYDLRVGEK